MKINKNITVYINMYARFPTSKAHCSEIDITANQDNGICK